MDLAAIHPLLPIWDNLDRAYLQSEFGRCLNSESGSSWWPWESNNPALVSLWEQLTHPNNLAALDDWALGIESFNDWARDCTLRALADCRVRAGIDSGHTA